MDDLQATLLRLTKNLAILQEREAKYAGHAPLDLLTRIEDYQTALALVEQARTGQLAQADLEAALARLNLELPPVLPLPPVLAALHQLPAPPADFTGRAAELAELSAALDRGGVTISGLRGMGGIGKTTLALKLAEALTPRYPDAQFYLDLRGAGPTPLTPADALAHVIRAYHPTAKLPEREADLAALYRSVLHGQQALLLFDNAASAAQLEPLLPPLGCAMLVTSRYHFHLPGLYPRNLDALPPADAQALLVKIAPRLRPSPPTPLPLGEGSKSLFPSPSQGEGPGVRVDLAADLAALCGYLPLALRLAASALAERPDLSPATYLARLSKAQKRLDLIEASLSLTFDLLPPPLQRLWCALSVFPADFDLPAAAAIWSLDPDEADERIGELLRYSLVEVTQGSRGAGEQRSKGAEAQGSGGAGEQEGDTFHPSSFILHPSSFILHPSRYFLHDLARLYAAAHLDPAARAEAEQRHAIHYAMIYHEATEFYKQSGDNIQRGLALFDLEWINIQAGQTWAEKNTNSNDTAAALCSAYVDWGYLLALRLHPRQHIEWLEPALIAAQHLHNREAQGAHLADLGLAYLALGEVRRAIEYHQEDLSIQREIGNRLGENSALGNLGLAYAALGETHQAIKFYKQQLVITRQISDRRGEGSALANLGNAYTNLSEFHKAIKFYEQALIISQEIGDRLMESSILGSLGSAYYSLGEPHRGMEYHKHALIIIRQIGDQRGEANVLVNMGNLYNSLGQPRQAIEFHKQALEIFHKIDNKQGISNALGNLGNIYSGLGEINRAIEYYEKQLAIVREIDDSRGEASALCNLGSSYHYLGNLRHAIELYNQALVLDRKLGNRQGEGSDLGNLGLAYNDFGQPDWAIEYYQQQLAITRKIGDRRGEGNCLGNLGIAYYNLGETRRAIEYYEQALVIDREIGDRRGEGTDLWNKALALNKLGQRAEAVAAAEAALIIKEQIEDPWAEKVRQQLAQWRGENS